MKLHFASDHAGFELKGQLIAYAETLGHEVDDLGAHTLVTEDDYPDYATPCAEAVAADPASFGVIIGATGQGEAMCANRIKGARAAVFYGAPLGTQIDAHGKSLGMIQSVREHNNANILCFGARFIPIEAAKSALKQFLETPCSEDPRHARRLAKF